MSQRDGDEMDLLKAEMRGCREKKKRIGYLLVGAYWH